MSSTRELNRSNWHSGTRSTSAISRLRCVAVFLRNIIFSKLKHPFRSLFSAVFEICVNAKAEIIGSFFEKSPIPLPAGGGLFKPSLLEENSPKSHQRKLVDCSSTTYSPSLVGTEQSTSFRW